MIFSFLFNRCCRRKNNESKNHDSVPLAKISIDAEESSHHSKTNTQSDSKEVKQSNVTGSTTVLPSDVEQKVGERIKKLKLDISPEAKPLPLSACAAFGNRLLTFFLEDVLSMYPIHTSRCSLVTTRTIQIVGCVISAISLSNSGVDYYHKKVDGVSHDANDNTMFYILGAVFLLAYLKTSGKGLSLISSLGPVVKKLREDLNKLTALVSDEILSLLQDLLIEKETNILLRSHILKEINELKKVGTNHAQQLKEANQNIVKLIALTEKQNKEIGALHRRIVSLESLSGLNSEKEIKNVNESSSSRDVSLSTPDAKNPTDEKNTKLRHRAAVIPFKKGQDLSKAKFFIESKYGVFSHPSSLNKKTIKKRRYAARPTSLSSLRLRYVKDDSPDAAVAELPKRASL